jgi:hypothetical protein
VAVELGYFRERPPLEVDFGLYFQTEGGSDIYMPSNGTFSAVYMK